MYYCHIERMTFTYWRMKKMFWHLFQTDEFKFSLFSSVSGWREICTPTLLMSKQIYLLGRGVSPLKQIVLPWSFQNKFFLFIFRSDKCLLLYCYLFVLPINRKFRIYVWKSNNEYEHFRTTTIHLVKHKNPFCAFTKQIQMYRQIFALIHHHFVKLFCSCRCLSNNDDLSSWCQWIIY